MILERIVSGAQTGVDRGALDAAIAAGVPHGGWCPRGRRAEDGRIPDHYALRETAERDHEQRTERNVVDSDGTLILKRGPLKGGTALTVELARRHGRPFLVLDLAGAAQPGTVTAWISEQHIRTLNVAGPRESGAPGISDQARDLLLQVLLELRDT